MSNFLVRNYLQTCDSAEYSVLFNFAMLKKKLWHISNLIVLYTSILIAVLFLIVNNTLTVKPTLRSFGTTQLTSFVAFMCYVKDSVCTYVAYLPEYKMNRFS
jgi:hypothetical protein